jgi:fatty-acyl-CoA synthase
MMDQPLLLSTLIERARTEFPTGEVVWRLPDRSLRRSTWAGVCGRAARLAHALARLGVRAGDRVATLSWNHGPHLEAYLAVPAMGAVLHTLNLRLHPSELAYIARQAEDSIAIVDRSLLPLYQRFRAEVPSLRHLIVVPDDGPVADGLDYEPLLAAERDDFTWPTLDENAAAMICYTSGTTGNPKGVVYSHRSTVLHTLVACMKDTFGVGEDDCILPQVPMFHANAWGLPYCALATGAKLVFPGPHFDPAGLLDLLEQERVTLAAGVPTVSIGILALLDEHPQKWNLSSLRSMIVGGAAAPPALIDGFRARHGITVTHAWGMTETSPLGSVARVKRPLAGRAPADELRVRASQGFPVTLVAARHVDETGRVLPRDGETMGELEVQGPFIAKSYFGGDGADRFTADGWFKTGDVVTIDGDGYLRICDRSKDVIKSGGEWISSVALENALMAHPAVLEAAVFAARHPKWDERPLAAIVLKPGRAATRDELRAHLEPQVAKFWLPDDFIFVEQIPRTSTGKFLKSKLRELYGDHLLK